MIAERTIDAYPFAVDEDTIDMAKKVIEDWNKQLQL